MEENNNDVFDLSDWVDGLTELSEQDVNKTISDILNNEIGALVAAFEEIELSADSLLDENGRLSSVKLKTFSNGIQTHLQALEEVAETISSSVKGVAFPIKATSNAIDAASIVNNLVQVFQENDGKEAFGEALKKASLDLSKIAVTSGATALGVGLGVVFAGVVATGLGAAAAPAIVATLAGVAVGAAANYISATGFDYFVKNFIDNDNGKEAILAQPGNTDIEVSKEFVHIFSDGKGGFVATDGEDGSIKIQGYNDYLNENLIPILDQPDIKYVDDNGRKYAIIKGSNDNIVLKNNLFRIASESFVTSNVEIYPGDKINLGNKGIHEVVSDDRVINIAHSQNPKMSVKELVLLNPWLVDEDRIRFNNRLLIPENQTFIRQDTNIHHSVIGDTGNNYLADFDGGNDTIDGKAGNDIMEAGNGDDIYIVDSTEDQVIEQENEGTDTVKSSVDYTLSDNVENLELAGDTDISGTGNEG